MASLGAGPFDLDIMQYALHTTSFDEQPLSDKSLSRFRRRCYEHERGEDLIHIHNCITALAARIAKLRGVCIKRMDSMMIAANPQRSFKRISASSPPASRQALLGACCIAQR